MAGAPSRRRLWVLIAVAVSLAAGGLFWQDALRLARSLRGGRMYALAKERFTAKAWMQQAAGAEGYGEAASFLTNVDDEEREALVELSTTLPASDRLNLLWRLAVLGSERAATAMAAALPSARREDLAAALAEVDVAALSRELRPSPAASLRQKRLAAKLVLALAAEAPAPACPEGAPALEALDHLTARAVLGQLEAACADRLLEHLDDPAWPAPVRARLSGLAALGLRAGVDRLVERVVSHEDPAVRVLAAQALLAGVSDPAARTAISEALASAVARDQAVEPRLAAATVRDLGRAR